MLEKDTESLKLFTNEKDITIQCIRAEEAKNKTALHKIQEQMQQTDNENARLYGKIEAQLKSATPISKGHVIANVSQDSTNDLELTASFEPSVKEPVLKKSSESKPKPTQQKKKTIMTKYTKRKKLLDDQDTNTLFDDFEFDPNLEKSFSTFPKRYTKRKKTIGT